MLFPHNHFQKRQYRFHAIRRVDAAQNVCERCLKKTINFFFLILARTHVVLVKSHQVFSLFVVWNVQEVNYVFDMVNLELFWEKDHELYQRLVDVALVLKRMLGFSVERIVRSFEINGS